MRCQRRRRTGWWFIPRRATSSKQLVTSDFRFAAPGLVRTSAVPGGASDSAARLKPHRCCYRGQRSLVHLASRPRRDHWCSPRQAWRRFPPRGSGPARRGRQFAPAPWCGVRIRWCLTTGTGRCASPDHPPLPFTAPKGLSGSSDAASATPGAPSQHLRWSARLLSRLRLARQGVS